MNLSTVIRSERFQFDDLRAVFAKANEEKSGDQLAGLAARNERERVAAKVVLADLTLGEIVEHPLIDPDADEVSRLILDSLDLNAFSAFRRLTVGEFREWILDDATTEEELTAIRPGLIPELAAAAAKLMSNKDLVLAASKIRVVTRCRDTMGQRGVLGIRVQPNHPSDDLGGILLSAADGLLFGCGDAVLGVNPAAESVEVASGILRALDRLIERAGDPHAGLLPGAYHDPTWLHRPWRARRPVISIDRRHRGGQRELRNQPGAVARGARARARPAPRARRGLGRRPGDVLRDRAGECLVGRRPSGRRPAHS